MFQLPEHETEIWNFLNSYDNKLISFLFEHFYNYNIDKFVRMTSMKLKTHNKSGFETSNIERK